MREGTTKRQFSFFHFNLYQLALKSDVTWIFFFNNGNKQLPKNK